MPTKKPITDLQQFLDERPLPKFFKDWITEKQLLQFVEIQPKTFRNIRYEKRVTYTILFKIPLYHVPDIKEQLLENMVLRKR